jgi:hypothetical protein
VLFTAHFSLLYPSYLRRQVHLYKRDGAYWYQLSGKEAGARGGRKAADKTEYMVDKETMLLCDGLVNPSCETLEGYKIKVLLTSALTCLSLFQSHMS